MTMGDRVAVMRKGALQQVAPPQELYDHPVNLFVGGFIGSPTMNLVEVTVERLDGGLGVTVGAQRLALAPEALSVHPALQAYIGRTVVMGLRPENLADPAIATEMPTDQRLSGKLMLREALGSEIIAHFEIAVPPVLTADTKELAEDIGTSHHFEAHTKHPSATSMLVARLNPRTEVREGQTIEIAVDTRALHFFDAESGLGIYESATRDSVQGEVLAADGPSTKREEDHGQSEAPSA